MDSAHSSREYHPLPWTTSLYPACGKAGRAPTEDDVRAISGSPADPFPTSQNYRIPINIQVTLRNVLNLWIFITSWSRITLGMSSQSSSISSRTKFSFKMRSVNIMQSPITSSRVLSYVLGASRRVLWKFRLCFTGFYLTWKYDTGSWELLVLKMSLEEWQNWLEGATHPFVVWIIYKNLQYISHKSGLKASQVDYVFLPVLLYPLLLSRM